MKLANNTLPPHYMEFLRRLSKRVFKTRGAGNRIIKNGGYNKSKVYIRGNNNTIEFGRNVRIMSMDIIIRGNDNNIIIGDNAQLFNLERRGNLRLEGNNSSIVIGKDVSIQSAYITVQEDKCEIRIGDDCMLSSGISIRTSDSHPIFDMITNSRINQPRSVIIGNHVWISAEAKILKGVCIGDGAIIGLGSIVTHNIPSNCIASGIPAKVIKQNINWNKYF